MCAVKVRNAKLRNYLNGTLSQNIELQCAYNNYISYKDTTINLILYLQFKNLDVRKVYIIIV